MSRHFAARESDLLETGRTIVTIHGMQIGLFRLGESYHAWRNVCPHQAAPVCVGPVEGTTLPSGVYEYAYGHDGCVLRCPWHGWEFDLRSGIHLANPEVKLKGYDLEVENGDIFVVLPGVS